MLTLQDLDLSTLSPLPPSIQQLTISNCSNLHALPKLISDMSALAHLSISHSSVCSLPMLSHTAITSLDLSDCTALRTLPDSLYTTLPQLQSLVLTGARSLQQLPADLGSLEQLRTLDLRDCQSLTDLPDCIGDLTSLTALDLSNCNSLVQVPSYAGNLKSLKILDLSGCARLADLPRSLDRLRSLETLDLSGCVRLGFIPEKVLRLPGLTIRLEGCTRLEQLITEVLQHQTEVGPADGAQGQKAAFGVESLTSQAAAGNSIRKASVTATTEPLLTAVSDAEASVPGTLSSSSKQQLSQMQRQCRRVYKLVHYPTRYLRPLGWLAKVLVIVAIVAVLVLGYQYRPTYWLHHADTQSPPAWPPAWSVPSLNDSSSTTTQMEPPQVPHESSVASNFTGHTGYYDIVNDINVEWSDEAAQQVLVPFADFPGVKRFKLIQVFVALPFVMKALLGAGIIAIVSAVCGLIFIALAYAAAQNQAWLNRQLRIQTCLTPEATAGRFWLLLVLSYTSSCTAITACYCVIYISIYHTMWAVNVRASSSIFGGVIPMLVWLFMPGFSVLGLGMLWIAEDMGRLFPGWTAVSAGMKAGSSLLKPDMESVDQ